MMRPLPWDLVQAEVAYRREQAARPSHRTERRRTRRAPENRPNDRNRHAMAWPGLVAELRRRTATTPPC